MSDSARSRGAAALRSKAAPFAGEGLDTLIDIMRISRQDAVRLAAVKELFDRIGGKAVASAEMDLSILVEKRLGEMTIEELEKLQAMVATIEPPLLLEADNDEEI